MGKVIEIVYGEDNTFQGQSAGQGFQPENKQMEGICPGLLFMFLS
jgi:hypothetical protein